MNLASGGSHFEFVVGGIRMAINPMALLKIKERLNLFQQDQPKNGNGEDCSYFAKQMNPFSEAEPLLSLQKT